MKAIRPSGRALFPAIAAAAALLAGSCAAPPKAAQPAPVAVRPPPPAPLPRPLPQPKANWRDVPVTAGTWTWSVVSGRSTARFAQPGGPVLASLSCDRAGHQVLLARQGPGDRHMAMALTTTTGTRPLVSEPVLSSPGWLVVTLSPRDPVLDAMAFSRGRFALEAAGAPTLTLPAWAEISRVIEDCR